MDRPKKLTSPDFSSVEDCVETYMAAVEFDNGDLDDLSQFIFETAVEAFYGPKVFDWVNEQEV